MAFAPTAGDNNKTVFLDAGHGGIDPGGVGTTESGQTIYESDVNLAIELDTMALLRARGYRVVVSRTQDSTVVRLTTGDTSDGVLSLQGSHDDVVARDACANLAKADALVGIYMDAGATSQNAGSVTVYDTDRPFSSVGDPSAGGIAGEAAAYNHLLLIGPAMSGYFSTPSEMPGAVVEPLYLTDPFEGSIAASSADQQAIARGMATAAEQFLAAPAGSG